MWSLLDAPCRYMQSPELKAALAGQVARTLVIMGVDEVVIYEDDGPSLDFQASDRTAQEPIAQNNEVASGR